MTKPLVSIIIPTFNRSNYIKRAINSALNQIYEYIEVIVIDDNSYDNTEKIVKSIKDKRVRYYKNSKNMGAPFSRNRGFYLSKGEYINFLDDDDELLPKKIELQLKKFFESDFKKLGVVTCDVEYIGDYINEIKKNRKKGFIYKDLLKRYCVYGTETMLIKRKYITNFDLNLKSNQEYDLAIRLSKICNFDYVPLKLTNEYESINQISFNFRNKIDGTLYLYKKYKNDFRKFGVRF